MSKTGWITLLVVCTLVLSWIIYRNTGDRRVCAEVAYQIEQQCHTFAECRISDDGIICGAINSNNEVLVSKWHEGDVSPTYGDIDAFCRELVIKQLSI